MRTRKYIMLYKEVVCYSCWTDKITPFTNTVGLEIQCQWLPGIYAPSPNKLSPCTRTLQFIKLEQFLKEAKADSTEVLLFWHGLRSDRSVNRHSHEGTNGVSPETAQLLSVSSYRWPISTWRQWTALEETIKLASPMSERWYASHCALSQMSFGRKLDQERNILKVRY